MFFLNILYDFPFYSLLILSFWISLRILNFPDLALDSSYAIGMAVLANLTHQSVGLPVLYGLLLALIAGFIVGSFTATLHELKYFKLSKLLSGLVVSFSFYSIIFRVNGEKTSSGLYSYDHEYNFLKSYLTQSGFSNDVNFFIFLVNLFLLLIIIFAIYLLLKKKLGLRLRAAGYAKNLIVENGRYPILYIILGLGMADAIAAITGCLRAATDNYVDINVFGTFLYALSGLLLGEKFISYFNFFKKTKHRLSTQLFSILIGGLLISTIVQLSIYFLSNVLNTYFSADIKLIIGLAVCFSASSWGREKRGEDDGNFA